MIELGFTVRNVLLGATVLGVVGGVLGCFALLRRQSLLGDALAHAALPGICVAFLVTGSKSSLALAAGAFVSGLVGALVILAIRHGSRIKEDAAIGIVLSVFFGVGIVLLTAIQRLPGGNQGGLDKFLFGQAAALVTEDLVLMAGFGALALGTVLLLYKELQVVTFDRDYAASLGLPVTLIDIVLTLLLVLVVVIGLQTVGVVLIVATLVTPAAAARQWTDSLGRMLALAGLLGGATGAAGALVSAGTARLPTGPVIVLLASAVLVVSLFLAPRRGILWANLRSRRAEARIRRENLLKDLYRLGEDGERWARPVPMRRVMGLRGQSAAALERSVRPLVRDGLLELDDGALRLSDRGVEQAAEVVRKHRLWELYLTRRLELPSDHVHRDAEAMEHALDREDVERLEEILGRPRHDPHGRPIPRPGDMADMADMAEETP